MMHLFIDQVHYILSCVFGHFGATGGSHHFRKIDVLCDKKIIILPIYNYNFLKLLYNISDYELACVATKKLYIGQTMHTI